MTISTPGLSSTKRRDKFAGRYQRYPATTGKRQAEGGRRLRGEVRTSHPKKPLITIITVCFNSSKTIGQTFQSVRDQTYGNIEYVVVDGNSSDGTVDLLKANEDLIDYYVSEPDEGLYYAMNKGVELAQGELIVFLNSDDWYENDAVEKLFDAFRFGGASFSGALARYVNDDGTSHVLRSMPFDHSVLLRMPLRHETMMIPSTLYDKVGPYDTSYNIISDYDFTVRLFKAGAVYYEVCEPLLNFRTSGVSNTEKEKLASESRRLLHKTFPFLSEGELKDLTDHSVLGPETYLEIANRNPEQTDFVRAARALLKDRKLHSGPRWKAANLNALLPEHAMSQPDVSVIIPFHNAELTLAATLDSVLKQDLSCLEVICVNDCSSDKSQFLVQSYADRDNRVRLIVNSVNQGPGGSRNVGIRAARGKFIFFLDADDSIPLGALKRLFDVARTYDSTIVRGAFRSMQTVHGKLGSGQIKYPAGVSDRNVVNTSLLELPALLASTEGHWSALYDADYIETILYPEDIRVGEDSLFLVKAFVKAPSITILPEVVYNYQASLEGAMNSMNVGRYFDGITWRRRAYHILRDAGLEEIGEGLLFNFWSEVYFDGLERTLNRDECLIYSKTLSEAFSDAGFEGPGATKNAALKLRIESLLSKYAGHLSTTAEVSETFDGLKIATFTTQDHGGAGLGTQRRVEALRKAGLNAHIYCAFRNSAHNYVHKVPFTSPLAPNASRDEAWEAWVQQAVLRRIEHPELKARELFSKTGSIVDFRDLNPIFCDAGVVHMHWVAGLFDYDHTEVLADKPVAWTLADMNAFTGGCHYSEGCEGYKKECRDCPLTAPGSTVAHEAWKTKRAAYAKMKNLHIICPSQWLADCAKASSLFGDRPVHMIPNAFPVDRFRPTNKLVARQKLGLPLDKKLIVFGADSLNNLRKGGDILRDSVKTLNARGVAKDVEGVFFGANSLDMGMKVHNMGHVSDETKLSLIYASADVFAFPSREDNAPLTVVEAMLSGTPVVGFAVGNVPELLTHKDTGYIARYEDSEDFSEGLIWALDGVGTQEGLLRGLRCGIRAARHNDPGTSVARHLALYEAMRQQQSTTTDPGGPQDRLICNA